MGQITIYLEKSVEKKVRKEASLKKISNSKYIVDILKEKLENNWPDSVVKLAGAWKDFPEVEEIRSSLGTDAERENL